jgi:hypothetical protein
MKARQTKKPVAMAESKKEPTDREPAALHEKGGERPRAAWRRFTIIDDDDWTRSERRRGHLKDALLPNWEKLEAMKRTQPEKPETVAEPKYEPTDYEQAVLAKQAQRLKDQVRVPRMKFDEGGGRPAFHHPDQFIAFVLLKEAFGTADDQFANGLLHYLCTVLPVDEHSACEFPRADDLNRAISLIAAGKAVDEIHAQILADSAVCRITAERLLHNLRGPLRFNLPEELRIALRYYKHKPGDEIDREVKIDNRPALEFSLRYAIRLMTMSIELLVAADRHRAIVESSRQMQRLSAVAPAEASLGEIKDATRNATPKQSNAARARRLNGSVPKTELTTVVNGNGHTPT